MIALPPAVQSSTTAVRPAFRRDEKPASFRHFGRRVGRLPGEPPHKRGGAPKAPIGRVRGSPLWLIFCADARVGGWEGLPSLVAGGGERLTLPLFGNDGRRRHQSPFRGVAPVNAQATPHIFIAFATPRQRRPLPILASGIVVLYRALPLYHRRGGGYSTKWPAMNPLSTRRASWLGRRGGHLPSWELRWYSENPVEEGYGTFHWLVGVLLPMGDASLGWHGKSHIHFGTIFANQEGRRDLALKRISPNGVVWPLTKDILSRSTGVREPGRCQDMYHSVGRGGFACPHQWTVKH
jgi:hypothetical protein